MSLSTAERVTNPSMEEERIFSYLSRSCFFFSNFFLTFDRSGLAALVAFTPASSCRQREGRQPKTGYGRAMHDVEGGRGTRFDLLLEPL